MSLFVAIRPPAAAVDHLEAGVRAVRVSDAGRGLRWQPPSRWHVTVAFLGDVEEPALARLSSRFVRAAETCTAVDGLQLEGSGTFNHEVLWVGLTGGPDSVAALTGLSRTLGSALRRTHDDHRPWRPHLTLARGRGIDPRPVADLLADYHGPQWRLASLELVRSTGGPHPVHEAIARADLVSLGTGG